MQPKLIGFTIASLGLIAWLFGSLAAGKIWLPNRGRNRVVYRQAEPISFWIEVAILTGFTLWIIYLALGVARE